MTLFYTVSQKKREYVLYSNFNSKSPIAIFLA